MNLSTTEPAVKTFANEVKKCDGIKNTNCPASPEPEQPQPTNLLALNEPALKEFLHQLGVPENQTGMRSEQLWNAIYVRGITAFEDIQTIPAALRHTLISNANVTRPRMIAEQKSTDGTIKWLVEFPPRGKIMRPVEVECVYIPEPGRGTLCVSSQVGCTLNCTFCHTGTQRLVRNLAAEEILGQIMFARDALKDWPRGKGKTVGCEQRRLTNVVMMGMGEPLYNFENVSRALQIAVCESGLALSRRRVTVSTSGVVPKIPLIGSEIGVMLAISLHAVTNEVRNKLVPLNRKYPIEQLISACAVFPGVSGTRRVTMEYVMLKDINDSVNDAKQLAKLLEVVPSKVNLIPFNPWPGSDYECSDSETIQQFAKVLVKAGYVSPVRQPRGQDIMAACGQLKTAATR